ncbi:MAG TPA: GGDEF domain-containing protein [Gemmata sp.]|jgi:diguanylate cyclase (GGDEF)-like protein|nr:GGDEF domain-containing protein [Gemmata sp.]
MDFLVVTTFQTAGTLLIAMLLRLLTRVVPGRFLQYWALGWVGLAVGLVSLNLSVLIVPLVPDSFQPLIRRPALGAYAIFQYVFGFSLWAGCRAYVRGTPLTGRDWWLLAPAVAFGVIAPIFLSDIDVLFPFHAGVFGGFCLLALLSTTGYRPDARQTAIGLRMTQLALLGLVILFWHYAIVMGWLLNQSPRPDLEYLHYSALYDALVETLLAFGMVVLGTDSVRRALETKNTELAETNRRLAEASEQLAVAARTDPLTGLLNRRALDAMLAERTDLPFSGTLAILDLNDLKKLNDIYGHAAGDAAIQLVARALRAQFRITDPVFRIGGDEFLVILEGGHASELCGRLSALDTALRGLRLPKVSTPVDLVVSWGMADFKDPSCLLDAFAAADKEMYVCKARRKETKVS